MLPCTLESFKAPMECVHCRAALRLCLRLRMATTKEYEVGHASRLLFRRGLSNLHMTFKIGSSSNIFG